MICHKTKPNQSFYLFQSAHIYLSIYKLFVYKSYIYTCVCVCVCVFRGKMEKTEVVYGLPKESPNTKTMLHQDIKAMICSPGGDIDFFDIVTGDIVTAPYTGVRQNDGNTRIFQTNLFQYGFVITALPRNPALCCSLFTVFEETGFSRWSLSTAVIFGGVFLWPLLSIHVRFRRSLSDSFWFLPAFCLSERVFPSFSNAVISFETVLVATPNNLSFFLTQASLLRGWVSPWCNG